MNDDSDNYKSCLATIKNPGFCVGYPKFPGKEALMVTDRTIFGVASWPSFTLAVDCR